MKTTGIIRRIDDLGRIVIPKELRRSLRIKNGDTLEVFVDNDNIILKKYSPMESIEEAAFKYVDSFNQVIKHSVIVCDKDKTQIIYFDETYNLCALYNSFINDEINDYLNEIKYLLFRDVEVRDGKIKYDYYAENSTIKGFEDSKSKVLSK